jgi:repressor LexA
MKELSPRQQQIFNFVEKYNAERKISPSIADIADGIGLAESTTVAHIAGLKRKGYLTSDYGIPRSFRIVQPEPQQCAAISS